MFQTTNQIYTDLRKEVSFIAGSPWVPCHWFLRTSALWSDGCCDVPSYSTYSCSHLGRWIPKQQEITEITKHSICLLQRLCWPLWNIKKKSAHLDISGIRADLGKRSWYGESWYGGPRNGKMGWFRFSKKVTKRNLWSRLVFNFDPCHARWVWGFIDYVGELRRKARLVSRDMSPRTLLLIGRKHMPFVLPARTWTAKTKTAQNNII